MNDAKISSEEIDYIRKYLEKQGVLYYDIQAELIDHFASSIEAMREKDPDISFRDALHSAHRNFGGERGFRKFFLISERNVFRKTLLLMGKTLLRFLDWPWIILTILIGIAWHFILQTVVTDDYLNNLFFIGLGSLIVFIINYFRLRNTPWYLPRQANNALGLIYYFVFYSGFPFLFRHPSGNPWLTSAFLTLLTLGCVAGIMLPDKLIKETKKIYSLL